MTQLVLRTQDLPPEGEDDDYRWWTLFTSESAGVPLGGSAGIIEIRTRVEPDDFGEGHAQAEFFYVLDGEGFVQLGADRHAVASGSAFIIPPSTSHGIWASSEEPLKAFFVALGDD